MISVQQKQKTEGPSLQIGQYIVDLSYKNLQKVQLKALIEKKSKNIKQIHLKSCSIYLKSIIDMRDFNWQLLSQLELGMNAIGDIGCKHISRMKTLNLKTLGLRQCEISYGIVHLMKSQWPNLQSINLSLNHIKGESMALLIRSNWKNLYAISMAYNLITFNELLKLVFLQFKQINKHWIYGNMLDKFQLNYVGPCLKRKSHQRSTIWLWNGSEPEQSEGSEGPEQIEEQ